MPIHAPKLAKAVRRWVNAISPAPTAGVLRRFARHAGKALSGTVEIDDFLGDLRITLDLTEHMQSRIFWLGGYNLDLLPLVTRRLGPGMVYVDVGANIGELTLCAAKAVGPTGRVIAFEPAPLLAARLRRNVERNALSHVQVQELGLADKTGYLPLYRSCVAAAHDEHNDGLASLIRPTREARPIAQVRVDTLDAWAIGAALSRIDLVKVDIEGGEIAFLEGAKATLKRFHPDLIIEVSSDSLRASGSTKGDLLRQIESLGYSWQFIEFQTAGALDQGLPEYGNLYCAWGGSVTSPAPSLSII